MPALKISEDISCTVIKSSRRSVELRIEPGGRVTVRAPLNMSDAGVVAFLADKRDFILKKTAELREKKEAFPAPPANALYVKGALLPVKVCRALRDDVIFSPENVRIDLTRAHRDRAETLLKTALHITARSYFEERMRVIGERAAGLGLKTDKPLKIKEMKGRWGSCAANGQITLNLKLFGAPADCIDAVIAHEFCHLKEMNHSARFYALWAKLHPDYKTARAETRQRTAALLAPITLTDDIFKI